MHIQFMSEQLFTAQFMAWGTNETLRIVQNLQQVSRYFYKALENVQTRH